MTSNPTPRNQVNDNENSVNPLISVNDWYTDNVELAINNIVNLGGNITNIVAQISSLFVGVASVYTGADQQQHQINYAPFIGPNSTGNLPVGTVMSAIYDSDPAQDIYSMQPLIDYVTAFNALANYATLPTPPPPTQYPILDYNTYINYVNAYNGLIAYYNLFPPASSGVAQYNVLLYKYATNSVTLRTKLNCIYSKILDPIAAANFIEYYNDLTLFYPQTEAYSVGNTAVGLYVLSRMVAYSAILPGQRRLPVPT